MCGVCDNYFAFSVILGEIMVLQYHKVVNCMHANTHSGPMQESSQLVSLSCHPPSDWLTCDSFEELDVGFSIDSGQTANT